MKNKISILFPLKNSITVNFTLYPLWISKYRSKFDFYSSEKVLLKHDNNTTLVILGKFITNFKNPEKTNLIKVLKDKYKTLIFFDDLDGSESHFLDLLPYFDIYYKKQLFQNRLEYLNCFYGNRIYSDYYFRKMGITEEPVPIPLPKLQGDNSQLNKMKLGWNLGIGSIPGSNTLSFKYIKLIYNSFGSKGLSLIQKKFPKSTSLPNPQKSKCQARFSFDGYRPTVGYQRKLFLDVVKDHELFLSGKIPLKEYKSELKNTKAVLSPFGWGEVCFRDFEAIFNGSVLVKPDMSHIETWPNLFQEDKTYMSIAWDGSDMVQKIENLLTDQKKMDAIRIEAWNTIISSHELLDEKILAFIEEIQALN